jgi:hypothetical protein
MQRDYGHSVSGLGPKQTAEDVAIGRRLPRTPAAGSLSIRTGEAPRRPQRHRAGIH